MIVVDQLQKGPIYRGIHKEAWNYRGLERVFDNDGFEYRIIDQDEWVACAQPLGDNRHWNWAFARMGQVTNNCANYSYQPHRNIYGYGFVLKVMIRLSVRTRALAGLEHTKSFLGSLGCEFTSAVHPEIIDITEPTKVFALYLGSYSQSLL